MHDGNIMNYTTPEEQARQAQFKIMFPKMKPSTKAPPLFTLNGCGVMLYGMRDQDRETQSYVTTLFLTLVFVPLFPIKAYRVVKASHNSYYFLGTEPLSGLCKGYRWAVACVALFFIASISWNNHVNSQPYQNRLALKQGKEMVASQQWLDATNKVLPLIHDANFGAEAQSILKEATTGVFAADSDTLRNYLIAIAKKPNPEAIVPDFSQRLLEKAQAYRADQPAAAMSLLDIVAKHPGDLDLAAIKEARMATTQAWWQSLPQDVHAACAYVIEREDTLDEAKQREILLPHGKNPFLLDSEAARILGGILFREERFTEAQTLLSRYTTPRMDSFHRAVAHYQSTLERRQTFYISELDRRKAPASFYSAYEMADEAEQSRLVNDYLVEKFKTDPQVQQALEEQEEAGRMVAPVMQLGITELNLSRSADSAEVRTSMLQSAEKTFLSIRGAVGDTDEYRLFLGEISYWLGKHEEGKKLFDELLEANQRSSSYLMEVAQRLRDVGEHDLARAMLEEAWTKESDTEAKANIAAFRQIMSDDSKDRLIWLERCDQSQAYIKTAIHENKAHVAIEEGRMEDAIGEYKKALEEYQDVGESASKFNNEALVWQGISRLSGKIEDFRAGVKLMERSLRLEQSAITMGNLVSAYNSLSIWQLNQKRFDLSKIPEFCSTPLYFSLCNKAEDYKAFVAEYLASPEMEQAVKLSRQQQVMAPKNPESYSFLVNYYTYSKNEKEMANLLPQIVAAKMNFTESLAELKKYYAGEFSEEDRANLEKSIVRRRKMIEGFPESDPSPLRVILETYLLSAENALRLRPKQGTREPVAKLLEKARQLQQRLNCYATNDILFDMLCEAAVEKLCEDAEIEILYRRHQWAFSADDFLTLLHADEKYLPKLTAVAEIKQAYEVNVESLKISGNDASIQQWIWSRSSAPDQTSALQKRIVDAKWRQLLAQMEYELAPYSTNTILYRHLLAVAMGEPAKAKEVFDRAKSQGIPVGE